MSGENAHALRLLNLVPLMERTTGRPEVRLGLIDGPVLVDHPDLADGTIIELREGGSRSSKNANASASQHGTFVAGILSARRGSCAPALCPDCSLIVRPVFDQPSASASLPGATISELATAIVECVDAGARILNLSLAITRPSSRREHLLDEALHHALERGAIVVAAAGNQGTLGSTAITSHPWVIPVAGCGPGGAPTSQSNLGASIGRRGLLAPGVRVTSLGASGAPLTLQGTSVAVPLVAGTIALLWSEFPRATASDIRVALTRASSPRPSSVVPGLLNATAAAHYLSAMSKRRAIRAPIASTNIFQRNLYERAQ